MRIAYIYTVLDESYKEKYPGVNKKVYSQVKELNRSGLDTTLEVVKFENKLKRILPFGTSSVNWKNLRVWEKYDGLYLRYGTTDYQMIKWLKQIKKNNPNFKVVVEIPTYPYEEELRTRSEVIIARDRKYRHMLKLGVDRLVINGKDEEVYGIPTILTPNGVDLDEIRIKESVPPENDEINLCFVAAFAMWHGADRVVAGLKNYYKNGGKRNIQIHFVGSGDDSIMNPLKQDSDDELVKNHIHFYGFMSGNELSDIYDKCQMAIASLGLHRLNIDAPSTLKSREYLGRGIPFIYSSEIADFQEHPVDFALQLSTDDAPVDFDKVIDFYDKLMKEKSEEELIKEIRAYAEKYVSIQKTMAPVEKFFLQK